MVMASFYAYVLISRNFFACSRKGNISEINNEPEPELFYKDANYFIQWDGDMMVQSAHL